VAGVAKPFGGVAAEHLGPRRVDDDDPGLDPGQRPRDAVAAEPGRVQGLVGRGEPGPEPFVALPELQPNRPVM
jgi:hypothetical protein